MRDLIVLGGGPAGYAAAARAGGMGKNVLLIEKDRLGGTCLNCGCVPTKSFLHAAKLYHHARHSEAFGVKAEGVSFDYPVMRDRTGRAQDSLRTGVAGLLKKSKVETIAGEGVILDRNRVRVGDQVHETAALLIAVGSRPAEPPIPGLKDNPAVVDSAGLLSLPAAAGSLAVIGGGVIGIEFACFYSLLGAKVTVIEMLPQICGSLDRELALTLQKRLESRGAAVHAGAKVEKVEGGEVFFTDRQGAAQSVRAERVLAAAGRVANLEGFG
ncbi:MAG: NAD(P)/FAD-dependent oxidoreductase, partial [Planctomycetota bacterium]|nr:NAD(P)/FAD-dependent oxidoreductase [Planctomycetota bacterium]